jgi:hypothetical protein
VKGGRPAGDPVLPIVVAYVTAAACRCPRCGRTLPAFEFARWYDHPSIKAFTDEFCAACREAHGYPETAGPGC